jgi:hypothetical protein
MPDINRGVAALREVTSCGIDLDQSMITLNAGAETYVSYADEVRENDSPSVRIAFEFQAISPRTLRQIKRMCGKLEAAGTAPYVTLQGEHKAYDGVTVKFVIQNAYECKYECVARKSSHNIRELTDGQVGNYENEESFAKKLK